MASIQSFFALGLLFSCCTTRIEETTKVLQIIFCILCLVEAQDEALELSRNETEFAETLVKRWIGNRVDYSES